MKRILILVSFLLVTNNYGLDLDSIRSKFPTLTTPTVFSIFSKNSVFGLTKERLEESGHATLARMIGGAKDVFNKNSKDYIYGRGDMHYAASSGSAGTIINLINAGYSFDVSDKYGNKPIHFAAASGSKDAVAALLKAGAKPDTRNQHGDTPLIFAVLACNLGGADVLLKQMSNNPKIKEDFLKTPGVGNLVPLQQSVISCPKLVKILLDHGANPNYIASLSYTPAGVGSVSGLSSQSSPALHMAASLGLSDIVDLLIKGGADVMLKDYLGQTALHKAAIARNSTSSEKLIKKGGQVLIDTKDNAGKTALDYTETGSGYRNWLTRWKLGKWY